MATHTRRATTGDSKVLHHRGWRWQQTGRAFPRGPGVPGTSNAPPLMDDAHAGAAGNTRASANASGCTVRPIAEPCPNPATLAADRPDGSSGVHTILGATAFTRIPRGNRFFASGRATARIAPFCRRMVQQRTRSEHAGFRAGIADCTAGLQVKQCGPRRATAAADIRLQRFLIVAAIATYCAGRRPASHDLWRPAIRRRSRPAHGAAGRASTEGTAAAEGVSMDRKIFPHCAARAPHGQARPHLGAPVHTGSHLLVHATVGELNPCPAMQRAPRSARWHAPCIATPPRMTVCGLSLGDTCMENWTDATHALPTEHECVRFIVSGHQRPLVGIYEEHSFRARWGSYGDAQVRRWHPLDARGQWPATHARVEGRYQSGHALRAG